MTQCPRTKKSSERDVDLTLAGHYHGAHGGDLQSGRLVRRGGVRVDVAW